MMILGVFFVSLLTFVCSELEQVPYVESIEALAEIRKEVEEQIMSMEDDFPNITDPRIHYAILMTHIVRVADLLTNVGPMYPEVYIDQMPESIVIGLTQIDEVVDKANDILEKIENGTQKLQDLIETLCPAPTSAEVCNQIVDEAVKGDPERYEDEAELIIDAGSVAMELLDKDLVEVAEEYDEVSYLIHHVDELHDLIMNLADVMKETNDDD